VRTLGVVVGPPVLDDVAGLAEAGEPVPVQAFHAVSAVEAFDTGVPGWGLEDRKRIDETELSPMIIGPSVERPPAQGRSGPLSTTRISGDPRSQATRSSISTTRSPGSKKSTSIACAIVLEPKAHDGSSSPDAVILEVGGAELATVGQRVVGEVERPALVGGDLALVLVSHPVCRAATYWRSTSRNVLAIDYMGDACETPSIPAFAGTDFDPVPRDGRPLGVMSRA